VLVREAQDSAGRGFTHHHRGRQPSHDPELGHGRGASSRKHQRETSSTRPMWKTGGRGIDLGRVRPSSRLFKAMGQVRSWFPDVLDQSLQDFI
jgi:hypothetical protein